MGLNIDLAPTMLSLAGVPLPASMQGHDLTPLISADPNSADPTSWREDWYYEHTYNTNPPRRPIAKCEGIRTLRWKYVRYPESEPFFEQLFDLQQDPREVTNLATDASYADVLAKLRHRCDEQRKSLE